MNDFYINIPSSAEYVLSRLNERGYEAYLVGGCVRDALIGRVPHDWDITTDATPNEMISCFPELGYYDAGIEHGTVAFILGRGEVIESTTYRRESGYSDGRHPDAVEFANHLEEDLIRRDFTINAMAYNPFNGLVDIVGGVSDLHNGIIRTVGDAHKRFSEDGLRIFRALRFACTFGYRIDCNTMDAMHDCKHMLEHISGERIQAEINKMMESEYPDILLDNLLEFADIIAYAFPSLRPCIGFDQRSKYHIHDVYEHCAGVCCDVPPIADLRIAGLLHDVGKVLSCTYGDDGYCHYYGHPEVSYELCLEDLQRLAYSNDMKESISKLVRYHDHRISVSKRSVYRMLSALGDDQELLWKLEQLKVADRCEHSPEYDWQGQINEIHEFGKFARECFEKDQAFGIKDLDIDGNDLIDMGYTPGPAFKQVLEELLDLVLDDKILNENATLRQVAAGLIEERV